MLKTAPAVFAVENNYQIMVKIEKPSLFSVIVGENEYFDESNGIMCSLSEMHRATVPMSELDCAKEYTVRVRPIIERKPYFTETEEPIEYTYSFTPVPENNAKAYHIADAHNNIAWPTSAAKAFGEIDFLILNGDVIDHSGDPSKFDNIFHIAENLTGGHKPVVFSRGNHDLRGNFAEKFAEYTPNSCGNTYYTFRLGSIWGVLLDCGEDKADPNGEYGYTVACHPFRMRQTAYLKNIIKNKENEYAAPGVKTRVVISHVPFTYIQEHPFDIEQDIYKEWTRLLREEVKPDIMLSGHLHKLDVFEVGSENDHLGQPCPVVIANIINKEGYVGCGITFGDNSFDVVATNDKGETVKTYKLDR